MTKQEEKGWKVKYSVAIRLALVSLLISGLLFPLLITGIAQVSSPYQANGEIVKLHGNNVGSNLIAQNFTQPAFFHPRNDSASGVDPDITLQDANLQIPRISAATGLSNSTLLQIVNDNVEGVFWVFGSPYVNVLKLNLILVRDYPSIYNSSLVSG